MIKSTLLLSTTIGLSLALGATAFAAGHSKHNSTVITRVGHQPSNLNAQGKLKGSAVGAGVYGATSSTTFTTLDNESVNCKSKAGSCTLELSAMVQQCGFGGSGDLYAVVTLVDGNYVDFGPYLGSTSSTSICDAASWQGIYSVGVGGHTVTYQEYESQPTYIAQWSTRSDVAVP